MMPKTAYHPMNQIRMVTAVDPSLFLNYSPHANSLISGESAVSLTIFS